jgi:acyl-CoA dehydrogenase
LLTGEKFFGSNAGAEVAVVAARPRGAEAGVRGLALFVLPRYRSDGSLNYHVRRLKDKIGTRSVPTGEVELADSEAYLLEPPEWGIYLILEVLNISRVANSIASAALAQRALAGALAFAEQRTAFGKPVLEHPLLRQQFVDRKVRVQMAFALAWEAVRLLDAVWLQRPRYSGQYHLFRLVAHLAKYWTAEVAVQMATWAMIVHGGAGVLADYPVERLLREAMILPIWEGTPHRQILDGIEVMERREAHHLLFRHLSPDADTRAVDAMAARVDAHLALGQEEKEARAETLRRPGSVCGLDRAPTPAAWERIDAGGPCCPFLRVGHGLGQFHRVHGDRHARRAQRLHDWLQVVAHPGSQQPTPQHRGQVPTLAEHLVHHLGDPASQVFGHDLGIPGHAQRTSVNVRG